MRTLALLVPAALLLAACGDSEGDGGAASASNGSGAGPTSTSSGTGGGASTSSTGSMSTSSAGGAGGGPQPCDKPETAGTTNETLMVGGVERTFVLVIPDSVDGKTLVPLVFGFHGFGGTGEGASQYFDLTGTEAAFYVYPQALPLPDQNNGIGWDMEPDGVDVAFFDALVADLGAKHCIDTQRIFAAGHSHGASFSNHLGCYRADVLRAIAPVSGGGPWAGPCMGSVSAMLTHGTNDDQVPLSSGEGSRDHWLEANGCTGAATMPVDPSPCVEYDGCSEPVRWCQHDGGHEWPDFAGAGIRGFFLSF